MEIVSILIIVVLMILARFLYQAATSTELPCDKPPLPATQNAAVAPAVISKPSKSARSVKKTVQRTQASNDLTVIEGIGPKIAVILNDAGIKTTRQLANTKVESLKTIITEGGVRFRQKVAETWPTQAELAASGQWDALAALQAKLKGGAH